MRNRAVISSILGMAFFMGCADALPTPPEPPAPLGPSHRMGGDDGNGLSESPEAPATESGGNDSTDSP